MTKSEFDKAVAGTRMKSTAIEMARDVICNNIPQADAGAKHGQSRQSAGQAVARVMRALKTLEGYPSDWVSVTVIVPRDVSCTIRELAVKAKANIGLS